MAPESVEVGGLHALRQGQGRPLVLLHGTALDSARLTWGPHLEALSEGREVWALDWPGHGESRPGTEPFTIASLAGLLERFTDEAGLTEFDAAAFSMGGAVLLQFMLDHPGRVGRAVLFSSYGLGRAVHVPVIPWAVMKAPGGPDAVWGLLKRSAGFREAVLRLLVVGGKVDPEIRRDVAEQMSHPHVRAAFLGWLAGELGPVALHTDLRSRLPEVQTPMTFAHGSRDRIIPPHRSRRAALIAPDARFASLGPCGHWALRENPGACQQVLREHL